MIELKNINKEFLFGTEKLKIFQDFNLLIEEGSFVIVFGPSGCGKSTLINLLSGIDWPDSGQVKSALGFNKQRIGYVSQNNSLLPWLTVLENTAFTLKLRGISKTDRNMKAREILCEMDLEKYENFYPRQLSGGLTQLVAFARAVAAESDLILMDEPFSSLDFLRRNKLQDIIKKLHLKYLFTVVFVTHQVDEALYIGERLVALAATKPTKVLIDISLKNIMDKDSEAFYKVQNKILNLNYQNEI